jgi:spore coat protein U-like protein
MKTMIRLTVIAALIAIGTPAGAQTLTGNFNVTASVAKTCVFQAAGVGALAFGAYDPLAAGEVTASTSFQFRCTRNTPYTIDLDNGDNFLVSRRMATAGPGYLLYDLDKVGGTWTAPWGTGGAAAKSGNAPDSQFMTHTVYGRIPAGQDPLTGSYTDNVVITVNY